MSGSGGPEGDSSGRERRRTPFVGLTGGIGAGKSTALGCLERLGCATLSTDVVVHSLYEDAGVVRRVSERFGADVAPGGVVDRTALAERAFGTPEDRAWLEALIWPLVGERMSRWREDVGECEPPVRAGIVEVPLLFESGMDGAFDATVALVADEQLRHERASARGHSALDERAARQLPQQEKAARATYAVVNDGTVEELEQKLAEVLVKIEAGEVPGT